MECLPMETPVEATGRRSFAAKLSVPALALMLGSAIAGEPGAYQDPSASTQAEVAVLFKTTEECLDRLVARLGECHPYDTPAIVGWLCNAAHPDTKQWLGATLGSKTSG